MMHMSFYISSTYYDFLFPGVDILTTWAMVSLCLGLVLLSMLSEGFKVGRSQLFKIATAQEFGTTRFALSERVKFHVLQTFFHVVHLTIGYILMLVVMTYNVYFLIAVVGGAGIGYFFFALFDLPGKILGAGIFPRGRRKANPSNSISQGSEGNPLCLHGAYGTTGAVAASSMGPRVSSELDHFSRNVESLDVAFENVGRNFHSHCSDADRTANLSKERREENCVDSGNFNRTMPCEEDMNSVRDNETGVVGVSDRISLLPQDSIKVEVQVHTFPEG